MSKLTSAFVRTAARPEQFLGVHAASQCLNLFHLQFTHEIKRWRLAANETKFVFYCSRPVVISEANFRLLHIF
jgi:hypothetical protein